MNLTQRIKFLVQKQYQLQKEKNEEIEKEKQEENEEENGNENEFNKSIELSSLDISDKEPPKDIEVLYEEEKGEEEEREKQSNEQSQDFSQEELDSLNIKSENFNQKKKQIMENEPLSISISETEDDINQRNLLTGIQDQQFFQSKGLKLSLEKNQNAPKQVQPQK